MDVQVKLYGLFLQYAPEKRQEFQLELLAGAAIEELLKTLKIPFDLDRILLVNGRQSGPERILEPDDTIVIFSPLCGGLPVIVLAPVDVKDCMVLTMHAFNLAEKYRCPVFVAANKEISMTRETFDPDALQLPDVRDRKMADPAKSFLPFQTPAGRLIPEFLPIGGKCLVRQTSSTHGPDGYITTDSDQIAASQERLMHKLRNAVDEFLLYDWQPLDAADTLVITYGVTTRAARSAIRTLEKMGKPVSHLVLKTLWPVPERLIKELAVPYRRIFVIEMNLGQYVREIRRLLPEKDITFLGQMNGELIKPAKIIEAIENE